MSNPVPEVISTYLTAAAASDIDTLVTTSAIDGEVLDESRTHSGREAIRAWRDSVASAYEYTLEVLGAEPQGEERYLVRTHLEGNFPGGQVDLTYRFTLHDGLIRALEIAP